MKQAFFLSAALLFMGTQPVFSNTQNSFETKISYADSKLYEAVLKNSPSAKKLALQNNIDPNYKPQGKPSLGELVIEKNLSEILEILVRKGLDLDYKNSDGMGYAYLTLYNGTPELLTPLFYGKSGEETNAYLAPLFEEAIERDHAPIMEVFLAPNLDQATLNNLLEFTADRNATLCSFSAISMGANINAHDEDGYTLLHKAIIEEDISKISLLLKLDANPRVTLTNRTADAFYFANRANAKTEILDLLYIYE